MKTRHAAVLTPLLIALTTESFGQLGNGAGYVCGVQLGNRHTPFGSPVHNFIDRQFPIS